MYLVPHIVTNHIESFRHLQDWLWSLILILDTLLLNQTLLYTESMNIPMSWVKWKDIPQLVYNKQLHMLITVSSITSLYINCCPIICTIFISLADVVIYLWFRHAMVDFPSHGFISLWLYVDNVIKIKITPSITN